MFGKLQTLRSAVLPVIRGFMRSYAREVAYCKVYAYLIGGGFDGDFSQFDADKLSEEDVAFATDLIEGVIANKAQLDEIVASFSRSFKLHRIYLPDLAAIELAIYEMQHVGTPHPVAINEAVGIVKKYSTVKSAGFVNGILAAYARSLTND